MIVTCSVFAIYHVELIVVHFFCTSSCQVSFSLLGNDICYVSFFRFEIVLHGFGFVFSAFIFINRISDYFTGCIWTSYGIYHTAIHVHSYLIGIKFYILIVDDPLPIHIGHIITQKYDKFRQINRFLEFIQDILPRLDQQREVTILDFGCGKSYLTFAMYYYLRELKGYDVNIIGLDLKTDVIEKCNHLAVKYGYEKLHFYQGDIADYEGVSSVDMVVTLHACDTATDYALAKAVEWGAKVILSVPCCQHEVNRQIKNEVLEPVLKYGILKERMAALMTDGIRANLLESMGYETQILEFIDMEHTPKNLLIRAVKTGKPKDMKSTVQLMKELHINPTLERLLYREGEVQSES